METNSIIQALFKASQQIIKLALNSTKYFKQKKLTMKQCVHSILDEVHKQKTMY